MKIAYLVTRSDNVGGAQVHVRDLAVEMQRRGHEAWVLAGGQGGSFAYSVAAQGVQWCSLPHLTAPIHPWHDFQAFREIGKALKAIRPDLLSIHSTKAGVVGRVVGRWLGVPTVFTAHGWSFTPGVPRGRAAAYRACERLVAPLAERIITVSEFDRQLAIRERVAPADRIIAIHNGMPDVHPGLRADPAASPARLVMIARFEPQKDHPTLLQALAGLQGLEWTLDLIGDGPLLGAVKCLGEELGLNARIRYWGALDDVSPLLGRAQVYLLASRWEGFPRSILESMRAGLPVVASAVGGVPEAVLDGETGYVVPRGDAGMLRQHIAQLLSDPGLRATLGSNGRTAFERRFTLGHMVARTAQVYQEVLGANSGRWARATGPGGTAALPGERW